MTGRAEVVATLARWPDPDWPDLARLPGGVGQLEVRADLVGDLDPAVLRRHFSGRLCYVLRSTWHGGACPDAPRRRHERLARAAGAGYDLVDLETDHDLRPDLLADIPPHRRRVCWHGGEQTTAQLHARFAWMAEVPAQLYLLAPAVRSAAGALATMRLLRDLGRADVTAFGAGRAGGWSRLLAPWLGAPVVFGQLGGLPGTGIPTVAALHSDYLFPQLPPVHRLYGIVGRASASSRSPGLHNLALRRLGLPGLYLPFQVSSRAEFHATFWPELAPGLAELGLPLHGLTVTAPHKEIALAMAAAASAPARSAGSANLLVRRNGRWLAETTDGAAVVALLRRSRVPLTGRPVAVLGCGGAGRSVAVGLATQGASVTLVNRGRRRGRLAADLLGLPFVELDAFGPDSFTVLVQATSLADSEPCDVDRLPAGATVVELVHRSGSTALVAAARQRGLRTIDGAQVLLAEAALQFRLLTGRRLPRLDPADLLAADPPVPDPLAAEGPDPDPLAAERPDPDPLAAEGPALGPRPRARAAPATGPGPARQPPSPKETRRCPPPPSIRVPPSDCDGPRSTTAS